MSSQSGETDTGVDRIDRSPPYLSSGLALSAALITTVASLYGTVAIAACATGLLALAAGLATGRQSLVTAGSATLVGGTIFAGIAGAPVLGTLIGVTAGILSWDIGSTAISVGDQLGREAPTARLELVQVASSSVVGFGVVLVGVLVYESAGGNQPVSAVFGLVVAVVILLAALRQADPQQE